jgi:5'-3' exoribonuclease 2
LFILFQGVALLPFVDEVRLKSALKPMANVLTPEEIRRNVRGDDRLYVRENHNGYNLLKTIYTEHFAEDVEVQMDGKIFEGMRGKVFVEFYRAGHANGHIQC